MIGAQQAFPHTLSRRRLLTVAAMSAGSAAILAGCSGTGTAISTGAATGTTTTTIGSLPTTSVSTAPASQASANSSAAAATSSVTSAGTAAGTSVTAAATTSAVTNTPGASAQGKAAPGALSVVWASSGTAIDHTNFAKLWTAFEATQPQVHVQPTEFPFAGFTDKIVTLFAGGEPPDVLYVNTAWVADFAGRQLLAPLDAYLAQDKTAPKADFYPASLQSYTWHSVLVGLPWIATPHVIYYNRALFQRAGVTPPTSAWTYDTFLKAAQALTNTQQSAPRYGYTTTPPGLAWISGLIWQNGGDVFDTSLTHCLLDATPALGTLQFDADLTTRYAVVPPQAAAKTVSMSAGNVGMALSIPASARQWTQITDSLGTVLPPNGTSGEITTFACNAFGIAKGAKAAANAWALTVFTTGDTAQQLIQQSRGGVPPRASVAAASALRSVYQPWEDPQVYQDALQHARALPQPVQFTPVDTAFQKAWTDVLAGKSDVKTAMQAVTQQANGLLAAAAG